MKGMFAFILGLAAIAAAVWYWQRNEGKLPVLEALANQGRTLSKQSEKFHESVSDSAEETRDRVSNSANALAK